MASNARAFCPGHITGFFQVVADDTPRKMGSRGGGLCLENGVTTEVAVEAAAETEIEVQLNGKPAAAEVTVRAVELYLEEPMRVHVTSTVDLPISQGLGMSGAGALSTLLALNAAGPGNRDREELVALAHEAEVLSQTGLGDVYPQSLGGLEIRERPGAPPHGKVQRIPVEAEVVVGVLGPPLSTPSILSNPMILQSINSAGRRAVDRFLRHFDLHSFFRLSWQFSRQTWLASAEIVEAVLKANLFGQASMCMLGQAIFAIGDADRLEGALAEHGEVYRAAVDNEGARLL